MRKPLTVNIAGSMHSVMHDVAVGAMAERGFTVRDYRTDSPFSFGLSPPWTFDKLVVAHGDAAACMAYELDRFASAHCDVTLLLLDGARYGRSSHWEAGIAAASGRKVVVLACDGIEPEPVYCGAHAIVGDIPALLAVLDRIAGGDDLATARPA
jgi:hypothetical protein